MRRNSVISKIEKVTRGAYKSLPKAHMGNYSRRMLVGY